jgi:hypothetical protein
LYDRPSTSTSHRHATQSVDGALVAALSTTRTLPVTSRSALQRSGREDQDVVACLDPALVEGTGGIPGPHHGGPAQRGHRPGWAGSTSALALAQLAVVRARRANSLSSSRPARNRPLPRWHASVRAVGG